MLPIWLDDLVEKITKEGWCDFDVAIATVEAMKSVRKRARMKIVVHGFLPFGLCVHAVHLPYGPHRGGILPLGKFNAGILRHLPRPQRIAQRAAGST